MNAKDKQLVERAKRVIDVMFKDDPKRAQVLRNELEEAGLIYHKGVVKLLNRIGDAAGLSVLLFALMLVSACSTKTPPTAPTARVATLATAADVPVVTAIRATVRRSSDMAIAASALTVIEPTHCGKMFASDAEPPPAMVTNPTQFIVDDPFLLAPYRCAFPLPMVPYGTGYGIEATFVDSVMQESAATVGTQTFSVTEPCTPTDVILDLGDWPKQVVVGGRLRVQFSLLRSQLPVMEIRLEFRSISETAIDPPWVVQGAPVSGVDLRVVSGVYFSFPSVPGRYEIRVIARATNGCETGSNRPATVTVVTQ